ncbi:hypothetical protein B0H63DRAFT_508841 [Podospora didyma]|uniref:Ubiquitin-like protease family profile domain-containing protein n=1 Tax=Podospora didyma TaxID=330526 RepID=A0AAE0NSW8_9PEZI|nr:hypothetical protein B0H63DRAFT_508841 [Podospora didyma]
MSVPTSASAPGALARQTTTTTTAPDAAPAASRSRGGVSHPLPSPYTGAGDETRLFRQRKFEEGDNFANELFVTLRNANYMSGCQCVQKLVIYSDKSLAKQGSGHLRFYWADAAHKELGVIERKLDPRWVCFGCGATGSKQPGFEWLFDSKKRKAVVAEPELLAVNQDTEIQRLIQPALEEPQHPPAPYMQTGFWANVTGRVATMATSVVDFLGRIRRAPHHFFETIDIRRWSSTNKTNLSVKRLKRQSCIPVDEPELEAYLYDLPYAVWTDDPAKNVGKDCIKALTTALSSQIDIIRQGGLVKGARSLDTLISEFPTNTPLYRDVRQLSIAIHHRIIDESGPITASMPNYQVMLQFNEACTKFREDAEKAITFMNDIYMSKDTIFKNVLEKHPSPPLSRLQLESVDFTSLVAFRVAKFFAFLIKHHTLFDLPDEIILALTKVLVDANAVHKFELVPSWIECPGLHRQKAMPGAFPIPIFDEIAVDELAVGTAPVAEPTWQLKHGVHRTPERKSHRVPREILKPRGILKPSKQWSAPESPSYFATPPKKRTLDFLSPVAKYFPPAQTPVTVMTSSREEIFKKKQKLKEGSTDWQETITNHRLIPRDSRQAPEEVEIAERQFGLRYHELKYGDFVRDMKRQLDERIEEHEAIHGPIDMDSPEDIKIPAPREPSLFRRPISKSRSVELPPILDSSDESDSDGKPVSITLKKRKNPLPISSAKKDELRLRSQLQEELNAMAERDRREELERQRMQEVRRQEEQRRLEEEERQRELQRLEEARLAFERRRIQEARVLRRPNRPLITPLPADLDDDVSSTITGNYQRSYAKTCEGTELSRRDFEKLIPPTAWLNDNIVNGCIVDLGNRVNAASGGTENDPKCFAFSSFFWTRLQSHGPQGLDRLTRRAKIYKTNFLSMDTIMMPICEGNHWTLAMIRPSARTVAHMDSMRSGAGTTRVKSLLLGWVKHVLAENFVEQDWETVDYAAPRQDNGYDCGVFTITNAICLALGLDPRHTYTARQCTLQRRRLAAVLMNGGFTNQFSLEGL